MNRRAPPKRVLLAYECGSGLGHLTRLASIARRLRAHDIETVLASFRLDDAEMFADAFDRILQAPVWPLHFTAGRVVLPQTGPSFATALANLGFCDPRHVTINQRTWSAMFEAWKPDVVVGDYAPGAMLAALGRCASMQVGTPFSTPALDGDRFPALVQGQSVDGALEQQILAAIQASCRGLGRPAPAGLAVLMGDDSLPMGFSEFDPYRACRKEPLLLPDMLSPRLPQRLPGSVVYAYLPEWMQHNDIVMATLCALKLPVRLFMPNIERNLALDLQNRGVIAVENPFSIEELQASASVFLHHGGFGSCHIGLMAGVPQIALEADMEKTVNGHAIAAFKVGQSLNYHRITLPKLRDAIHAAAGDGLLQERAARTAGELGDRLRGPHPHDVVVQRVVERVAV